MEQSNQRQAAPAALSAAKQALLEQWRRGSTEQLAPTQPAPTSEQGPAPLAFGQQRLWFLDQLDPGNAAYVIRAAARLQGALDLPAFAWGLRQILRRHTILRTSIVTDANGSPVQQVLAAPDLPLQLIDVQGLAADRQALSTQTLLAQAAQRSFDLFQGPLWRLSLIRQGPTTHLFLLAIHHSIADGWSLDVFFNELAALYRARLCQQASELAALPMQYADYARWQRGEAQQAALQRQLAYWQEHLQGAPLVLELPTDHRRPPVQRFQGASHRFTLSPQSADLLSTLGRQEGCTLFTILLAALNCLLARYTRHSDIIVGTDSTARTRVELEPLIGFFVNQLVIRTRIAGTLTFRELVRQQRAIVQQAYAHSDLPFEQLVDALQLTRDLSHNPLFQVLFSLEHGPAASRSLPGLQVEPLEIDNGASQFDLAVVMREQASGIEGCFEYDRDLFEPVSIAQMAEQFVQLLQDLARNPERRIAEHALLTAAQWQQRLRWNATRRLFAGPATFAACFRQQVERTPEALAVVCGSEHLTYRELERRASCLASALGERGLGAESLVAILVARGIPFLVTVIGAFYAGCAYLPLSPEYPPARLAHMLQQSRAAVVVVDRACRALLEETRQACLPRTCPVSEPFEQLVQASAPVGRPAALDARNLAYVIFTSGSTGTPRGAMIEQAGMLNHLWAKIADLHLRSGERLAQTASVCFDISVWQFLAALLCGGSVLVLPDDISHDPLRLLAETEQSGVAVLEIVPSLLQAMLEEIERRGPARPALAQLRWLVLTGEALPADLCRRWQRWYPYIPLLNAYGPTECSDDVTHYPLHELGQATRGYLPIGSPLANTEIALLDTQMQHVPLLVAGQLCVGGIGVGRGYVHDAARTAQVFVPHPYSQEPGARLYCTGDLARYRHDGTLDFLMRLDHQVKIRGFRIEPGELEAALKQHPQVRDCVVVARQDRPGTRRLVAYLVLHTDLAGSELRQYLAASLPEYMLPAAFVFLDALPLTSNGKVDRRALPAPEDSHGGQPEADACARTPIEATLARIWVQVLGLERAGRDDNFFALGGDSISSMQVVHRVQEAGLQVTARQLFQHQTIAQLARVVTPAPPRPAAPREHITGAIPLTPMQRWFFRQGFPDPHHWNQDILLEVRQPLDMQVLARALEQLVAHHPALRLRFQQTPEGWVQESVGPEAENLYACRRVDLSALPEGSPEQRIAAVAEEAQRGLHIGRGPLLSVVWMDCGEDRPGRLLLVLHHLVVDGVSWRLLLDDLQVAYRQLLSRQPVQLPPPTAAFQQWARQLAAEAPGYPGHEAERAFWLGQPWKRVRPLPCDLTGDNRESAVQTVTASLSVEETQALLQTVPAVYHTQITEVLLTALTRTLLPWMGGSALLVDLEGHGREDLFAGIDTSRSVGWFTTIFPVILTESGRRPPGEALKAIKEQVRGIPRHGFGFGVLRELCQDEALQALPAAEVCFNYLGRYADQDAGLFSLAPEFSGPPRSPAGRRAYVFDITARVLNGAFQVNWEYSAALHRRTTLEALARSYMAALQEIIAHCQQPEVGGYTPSDFPGLKLDQKQLDSVLNTMRKRGRQA
jgi:amino acid adenylation domain-containing protein/non-ribosomal peptide synthase protein (TIGR01720 family)